MVAAYTAAGFSGDEAIPAFKMPQMHLSGRVSTIFASHPPPTRSAPQGVLSPVSGCARFPAKSFQNTFGDLQLSEMSTQFFSFRIEALDPFANPFLLLTHQPSHLLTSPLSQVQPPSALRRCFHGAKTNVPKAARGAQTATRTNF